MVTKNSIFVRESRVQDGRVIVHGLGSSLAAPTRQTMSSKDEGPPKRRESRSGTRKVSHLSAEQLERKRANDREAQRSIRQRTKEHIEQLEHQVSVLQARVAELQPRSERFDALVQQNVALQNEVNRLKQQLGIPIDRPAFPAGGDQPGPFRHGWHMDEGPSNATNPATSMLSPFPGSSHPPNAPRAPSAVSASSRSPHPHDWQQYSNTRSPSLGDTSESDYSSQPYVMEGQLRRGSHLVPPSLPVAPQLSFGAPGPRQQPSESSFPQIYPREGLESPGQLSIEQPSPPFLPSQAAASAGAQPASGQPYPPSVRPYQNPMGPQTQRDPPYPYPWNQQS
ncbi:hypothetical protein N7448_007552 [Penicillium atrosanguineum]|nr:hypothetical protein N7448_007552 [Penicillium atrosanguineum]